MRRAQSILFAAVASMLLGCAGEPLSDNRHRNDIIPAIVFVPPDTLQAKTCNRDSHCLSAKALYVPREQRIYLRNDWSANNFHDLGILLHEFVHHLQFMGKLRYNCDPEIELPAYGIQEAFYREHRRSPDGHVPSDFTRFGRYSCIVQE